MTKIIRDIKDEKKPISIPPREGKSSDFKENLIYIKQGSATRNPIFLDRQKFDKLQNFKPNENGEYPELNGFSSETINGVGYIVINPEKLDDQSDTNKEIKLYKAIAAYGSDSVTALPASFHTKLLDIEGSNFSSAFKTTQNTNTEDSREGSVWEFDSEKNELKATTTLSYQLSSDQETENTSLQDDTLVFKTTYYLSEHKNEWIVESSTLSGTEYAHAINDAINWYYDNYKSTDSSGNETAPEWPEGLPKDALGIALLALAYMDAKKDHKNENTEKFKDSFYKILGQYINAIPYTQQTTTTSKNSSWLAAPPEDPRLKEFAQDGIAVLHKKLNLNLNLIRKLDESLYKNFSAKLREKKLTSYDILTNLQKPSFSARFLNFISFGRYKSKAHKINEILKGSLSKSLDSKQSPGFTALCDLFAVYQEIKKFNKSPKNWSEALGAKLEENLSKLKPEDIAKFKKTFDNSKEYLDYLRKNSGQFLITEPDCSTAIPQEMLTTHEMSDTGKLIKKSDLDQENQSGLERELVAGNFLVLLDSTKNPEKIIFEQKQIESVGKNLLESASANRQKDIESVKSKLGDKANAFDTANTHFLQTINYIPNNFLNEALRLHLPKYNLIPDQEDQPSQFILDLTQDPPTLKLEQSFILKSIPSSSNPQGKKYPDMKLSVKMEFELAADEITVLNHTVSGDKDMVVLYKSVAGLDLVKLNEDAIQSAKDNITKRIQSPPTQGHNPRKTASNTSGKPLETTQDQILSFLNANNNFLKGKEKSEESECAIKFKKGTDYKGVTLNNSILVHTQADETAVYVFFETGENKKVQRYDFTNNQGQFQAKEDKQYDSVPVARLFSKHNGNHGEKQKEENSQTYTINPGSSALTLKKLSPSS